MTKAELLEKLKLAQNLLADVYAYAEEFELDLLERQMSVADSCIWYALEELE